jgi:hypothetical protein
VLVTAASLFRCDLAPALSHDSALALALLLLVSLPLPAPCERRLALPLRPMLLPLHPRVPTPQPQIVLPLPSLCPIGSSTIMIPVVLVVVDTGPVVSLESPVGSSVV